MGIGLSYSNTSLIAEQSQIYRKWQPQRNLRFWSMAHLPQAALPVNERKYFSLTVQLREPKAIGFSLSPFLDKSKRQMPLEDIFFIALIDSLSSAGCIIIHPIPSLLQSVFRNVGLVVSNLARIGEEVIPSFRSANNLTKIRVPRLLRDRFSVKHVY